VTAYVLGFDVGGTGVRAALGRLTEDGAECLATYRDPAPIRIGPDGVEPSGVIDAIRRIIPQLLAHGSVRGRGPVPGTGADPSDRRAGANSQVAALAIGCTGAALLGAALRRDFAGALAGVTPTVVLCSDVLTSHIGALGLGGGAVLAAGTGAVALGSDGHGRWRRTDGWGVLLGDIGGGAWIGRAGIDAALRAHDGRPGGSPALLAALTERFGSPADLVQSVAGRPDRGAILASFTPDVAAADDPIANSILRTAGHHLADTLLAAVLPGAPPIASTTGNLFQAGPPLTAALAERVADQAPDLQLVTPAGTSLDGAVTLAAAAVRRALPPGAGIELLASP